MGRMSLSDPPEERWKMPSNPISPVVMVMVFHVDWSMLLKGERSKKEWKWLKVMWNAMANIMISVMVRIIARMNVLNML